MLKNIVVKIKNGVKQYRENMNKEAALMHRIVDLTNQKKKYVEFIVDKHVEEYNISKKQAHALRCKLNEHHIDDLYRVVDAIERFGLNSIVTIPKTF